MPSNSFPRAPTLFKPAGSSAKVSAVAAAALLFASVTSGVWLSIPLFYLAPLPIMIAGLGWSHWSALVAAVAAAQKAAADTSAIDGAAKDLAAAQAALQAAQDAAAAAAAKATATAGTASGSEQVAQKSQAAQAAAEGAVAPIQKTFDQKVAQLLVVDKTAQKSEADAKAARAAANAAKVAVYINKKQILKDRFLKFLKYLCQFF